MVADTRKRKVWLVRHGNRLDFIRPEWFLSALFKYDPPLCPAGKIQAQETAKYLSSKAIAHIFVSPYCRTIQTALPMAIAHNLPLNLEAGLGEWENPDWMGEKPQLTNERIVEVENVINRDYRSLVQPQYPETQEEMWARAKKTTQFLVENYAGNLLIVGHKESLFGAAIAFLGKEPDFDFDVCGITEFCWTGDRWKCTLANDQSHLSDPGVKVAEY
ncbi:histidine phosphatase family protein [[Limnothrix rosea] IAM M-220]|uniref:histidine phosphatase family protein n=1 Tax=[Limnothrix rosea] IAM M-220 TaxID=454133 RepID=UPI0009619601|nr:histidine phosphatase family protein [[Limnothrix rosea] IAM M-220]OKH18905.1 hypothetical protein NIES208_04115 [[Limnothrix rosea] IAM M-220]